MNNNWVEKTGISSIEYNETTISKVISYLKDKYEFDEVIELEEINYEFDENIGKSICKVLGKKNNWFSVIEFVLYYDYGRQRDGFGKNIIVKEQEPETMIRKGFDKFIGIGGKYIFILDNDNIVKYDYSNNIIHRYCENDGIIGKIAVDTLRYSTTDNKLDSDISFISSELNAMYKNSISVNDDVEHEIFHIDDKDIKSIRDLSVVINQYSRFPCKRVCVVNFTDNSKKVIFSNRYATPYLRKITPRVEELDLILDCINTDNGNPCYSLGYCEDKIAEPVIEGINKTLGKRMR